MNDEDKKHLRKLKVNEIKELIKMYKKERNIGGLKKHELIEHFHHLHGNGKLKPKYRHLQGAGIFDFIKNVGKKALNIIKSPFDKAPEKYTKSTKKCLDEDGNVQITSIQAKRTPVVKVLTKVIDVVTRGKFSANNDYDKLYHLALICGLADGKSLVVEKNEVINISRSYKMTKDTESIDIPLNGKNITVNQMLENALKKVGSEQFYLYDPVRGANCQNFVIDCLKSSSLGSETDYKWIFQDMGKINDNLSHTEKTIMTGVTSLGANFKHFGEKLGLGNPNTKL